MSSSKNEQVLLPPAIRRIPVGELTIIEITKAELETLERGSQESIHLNLGIFMLSAALSFTISLMTSDVPAGKVFDSFMIITVISYIAFVTFTLLWLQSRRNSKTVSQEIRERLIPEGIQESVVDKIAQSMSENEIP